MLNALYNYAKDHSLVPPSGYVEKVVKAYISLSSYNENFAEIEMEGGKTVLCPDIGSLANGKDKCNVLAEKRLVVFSDAPTAKSQFFWEALKEAGEYEPTIRVCLHIMEKPEMIEQINQKLDVHKVKPSERVAFKVDGKAILNSDEIQEWWQSFRGQFLKGKENAASVCMITGRPTTPVMTTSSIIGLQSVGGHARGDALICFDKTAFCSYGFKQAENAPVSEDAFAGVKAALDSLLREAPVLSNMKFVHWYDCEVKKEEDPICQCDDFSSFWARDDEEDEETIDTERQQKEAAFEKQQKEIAAVKQADRLIHSVESGERPTALDCTYYILLLSGVGGRIMIRRYARGKYRELQENLEMWQRDLLLSNAVGTAMIPGCKLTARLIRLLKYKKTDTKAFERLKDELAGVTPSIVMAILMGGRLPDTVAERALRYIRSQMLSSAETEQEIARRPEIPDGWACQWLKVWLIRKKRAEGEEAFLMESYNLDHPSAAYHCGGLMAVYARIQQRAIDGVNAGVIQRYYASASRTPAMVLSRLARLCNYHLAKLEKTKYFENCLAELYCALGDKIPVTLNLEEQSYFALGYYQKWAQLNTPKAKQEIDLNDENKENEENKVNEED